MRRKAMPKFPRANPDVKDEQTQAKSSNEVSVPSQIKFIEFNGEKLYPQMIQGQDKHGETKSALVFSATKPAVDVSVPQFKVHLKKMHWYVVEGKIVLSEGQPINGIRVDELRKNITKQVVTSYLRSKPNAHELQIIDAMVKLIVNKIGPELGKDLDGLSPELMQSMTKSLVKDWKAQKIIGFSEEAIEAAKQVVRFDGAWKAIKSSCAIHPNDFVELNKRYNKLQGKDGAAVNNKDIEEFLKSFKSLLGGSSISRKVLFSKEFNSAMQLHINDPENSKTLFSALKRDKAYDPAKLCKDYVERMNSKDYGMAKSEKAEVTVSIKQASAIADNDAELKKIGTAIAKVVVKSFWGKPTKAEMSTIEALVPMIKGLMGLAGEDLNSLAPQLLQSAVRTLIKDSEVNKELTEVGMQAAQKVVEFNSVWKTIKASCAVYPKDVVELSKRFNKLETEQPNMDKKSVEEFIRNFKDGLGGISIDRKVLFSPAFMEAMKLHLNDPESSKKLLNNLKRSNGYDQDKLCKAYISCMNNIKDYREFMPDAAKDKAESNIDQFIINASNQIKTHEINSKELNKLKDFLIPDSAFITFPKKMYTVDFAEKFGEKFPNLNKVFGDIVKQQNPKEFKKVESNPEATKKLLDKKIQSLVGELSSKLQSEERKMEAKMLKSQGKAEKGEAGVEMPKLKKFNIYREFQLLESATRSDLHPEPKAPAQAQEQEAPAVVIHMPVPEGAQQEQQKPQRKDLEAQTHMVKNLLESMKLIKVTRAENRQKHMDVGEAPLEHLLKPKMFANRKSPTKNNSDQKVR